MDENMSHSQSEFPTQFDSFFFKRVWYIFQDYRKFLVLLIFATSITAIVFGYFAESIMGSFVDGPFEPDAAEPSQVIAFTLSQFAEMLLILIPKVFFLVVFISVLPKMYENEQIVFSESIGLGFTKLLSLYMYSSFVLGFMFLGIMMLIIPGLIVLVQCTFLQFVIVLEGNTKAIPRAFHLISGKQWQVFSIYIIKFGVMMLIMIPAFMQIIAGANGIDPVTPSEGGMSYIVGFIQEFILEGTTYFITALFFQLYMVARIENKEIEIVQDK